jgi:MFS family permease
MCRPPCPGGASSFETARCCGQLVALRFIKGRRRTSMLALCAAGALSWAVIASSDSVDGWVAVALVVGLGMFGLGETLWAPVAPAIVNDLAPEELRGRYNALQGMTWTIAMIIGPALSGLLIGNGLATSGSPSPSGARRSPRCSSSTCDATCPGPRTGSAPRWSWPPEKGRCGRICLPAMKD